jgi:hypothetical protein
MKYYGIFDKNNNYKLLRYSTHMQSGGVYDHTDPYTKTTSVIEEVCFPDIEYADENIGKTYDPVSKTFL